MSKLLSTPPAVRAAPPASETFPALGPAPPPIHPANPNPPEKALRFQAADFQPHQDLEPITDAPAGTWQATGNDPQFVLACSLPAGWVRIRVHMTSSVRGRIELFADTGAGFHRDERLERADADPLGVTRRDFFVHCPRPVRALRFDPLEQPGQFHLEELRVETVAPRAALFHAARAKLRQLGRLGRLGRGLCRALSLLFRGQLREIRRIVLSALEPPALGATELYDPEAAYQAWRRHRALTDKDRAQMTREAAELADPPRLSLLLAVPGGPGDVARALESVRRQIYPHWELCVAAASGSPQREVLEEQARNEPRLRLHWSAEPASWNHALALATGSHVGLLGPVDELPEHALFRVAQALAQDRELDLLYSDEDLRETDGRHRHPFFKPDWSPEYLLACPYTGRLALYRTERVRQLGGFRLERGTAAEYDLVLRLTGGPARVGHLPDVLYHRRPEQADPAAAEAQRQALRDRLGQAAAVEPGAAPGYHRVRFALRGIPKVSILIPSACRPLSLGGRPTYLVRRCVESIRNRSTYDDYEIVLIHNRELPGELAPDLAWLKVRTLHWPAPFNWAASMNQAAAIAGGDHLLFLNDDTEVLTPDWLEVLLEFSQLPAIGAVGARLLFPDHRLQHAGIILAGGQSRHCFHCFPADHAGYHGNTLVHRNYAAVTGACLMTRAEVFRELGGFEESFALSYSDVDYCHRVRRFGRRVVYTPHAQLIHYEAATRAVSDRVEREAFLKHWGPEGMQDPFYNPNLSAHDDDYRIETGKPG